jgi:putative transposase
MVEITCRKHSVGQSAYHLVWRPKYNFSVFRHSYPRKIVMNALKEVATKWKIFIYEMEVMPDHIHMFVEIPPTMIVSFSLQILKGGSARIFFQKCTIWKKYCSRFGLSKPHLWSPGKFFRSVGSVTAEAVENYIKNSNKWEFDFIETGQTKITAY